MYYLYGTDPNEPIEAKDIDFAVKKIKMIELYPENQAEPKPFKLDERGYPIEQENYIDFRGYRENRFYKIDESLIDKAFVPLYEGTAQRKENYQNIEKCYRNIEGKTYYFYKVYDIPLRDLLSVNYNSLLLECKTDAVSTNEIAVVQKQEYITSDERRIRIQQINEQMAEMHRMKKKLENELAEMNRWVEAKTRVIKAYETYLGSYEEITQLIKGHNAAEEEPLHIYQQKLFMDEEIGILKLTEDPFDDKNEFDWKNIDEFDRWIKLNYQDYLKHEKSLCVFQVKRYEKDYIGRYDRDVGSLFYNTMMNFNNKDCYILIRNGENLYRLWENLSVPLSVFPTQEDIISAQKDSWGRPATDEEVKKNLLPWSYVGTFLQGLIDRTDIFGNYIKNKFNLLLPLEIDERYLVFERNLEQDNLIEDKFHINVFDYMKKNVENTKVGDFIFFDGSMLSMSEKHFREEHDMYNRKYLESTPERNRLYKVYEIKDKYSYKLYKILYWESDKVWKKVTDRYIGWDNYDYAPRQRRTGAWIHKDEFFNLSQVKDKEELLFFIQDRRNRTKYMQYLPKLITAYKMMLQLEKGDTSFVMDKDKNVIKQNKE